MQSFKFQPLQYLQVIGMLTLTLLVTACEKDEDTDKPGSGAAWRLDYLEIKENAAGGLLYLHGYFGDSTANAAVFVNGGEMTSTDSTYRGAIKAWQPWMITCQIPPAKSPYGKGPVYVRNKNIQSNTRTLRAWNGDILFHRPDQGSLEREIRMNVYLRADVDPHGNVARQYPASSFGAQTKALYKLGGQGSSTYNDGGGCVVTVTANLEPAEGEIFQLFPFTDRVGETEYFQSQVHFMDDHFDVTQLEIFKEKVSTRNMSSVYCPETSASEHQYDLYGPPYELAAFKLYIEPGTKKIKAGQLLHRASTEMGLIWDNGMVPQYDCTLSWEEMKLME